MNLESQPKPDESIEEGVLLRLFRCMSPSERSDLIYSVLKTLAARCSLDPHYRFDSAESIKEECADPNLDERLAGTWPGDWPGQGWVELDNLGDPGYWVDEAFGEPVSQVLFGWAWDDAQNAAFMANSYLHEVSDMGYPLPGEYAEPSYRGWTKEDEADIAAEFVAFLRHWRERVLQALEEQNRPDGAT